MAHYSATKRDEVLTYLETSALSERSRYKGNGLHGSIYIKCLKSKETKKIHQRWPWHGGRRGAGGTQGLLGVTEMLQI